MSPDIAKCPLDRGSKIPPPPLLKITALEGSKALSLIKPHTGPIPKQKRLGISLSALIKGQFLVF